MTAREIFMLPVSTVYKNSPLCSFLILRLFSLQSVYSVTQILASKPLNSQFPSLLTT